MANELIQALQQWGTAGLIAIAAGYVLYDAWKKNKETEKWLRDQVKSSSESCSTIRVDLGDITTSIKEMKEDNAEFREEIKQRVKTIEDKIDKRHPDHNRLEAVRLNAISQIAPSIHTIINDGLGNCKCDHIGVALLHNGSVSLSGVPYIKFGIIAEKYKPIRCPHDIDLSAKYKEEDIMQHNRLPSCVVQNKNIEFEIEDDSILVDVDPSLYLKCKNLGIKRIAFEAFQDIHGLTTGFIVIYKFNSEPFDMDALHSTANTIEHLYQNMLASFD